MIKNYQPKHSAQRLFGKGALALALILVLVKEAATDYFVYVSMQGSNFIGVYKMDPESGLLEAQAPVAVTGAPASLALSPDKKFVYAAQRNAQTFSAFAVNRSTGALTSLNTVPAGFNPVYIATDRTGKYLLAASYNGNRMAVHPLGTDGRVLATATDSRATGEKPHGILIDATNRFLYVPVLGPGTILQFAFDEKTGKLQPLNPPEVTTEKGAGPRHMIFHGSLNIAYVANELNSSVTAYAFDPNTGTLTSLQTLSTLPAGFTSHNTVADIHITPDNRFLYVSNRGHESLAGYKLDPVTGQMTALGQFATTRSPRAFGIDPTGKFLFSAGFQSDSLATYRINQTSGHLEPLKTYATGKTPSWVMAVYLGEGSVSVMRPGHLESSRQGIPGWISPLSGSRFYDILGRLKSE